MARDTISYIAYQQNMADYYYAKAASTYLISTYHRGYKRHMLLDNAFDYLMVANDYEKTVISLSNQVA